MRAEKAKDAARSRTPAPGAAFGSSIGRPLPGPDRQAILGSVAFHVGLIVLVWASGLHRSRFPEVETYRVRIVSPPAQVEGPREPERPTPAPAVVQAPRPDPPRPRPQPQQQQRVQQTPPPRPAERPRDPEPVRGPDPRPTPIGGDDLNVDLQGQDFPFPEYLENIILQVHRHFRWSGAGHLTGQVGFFIRRDGSVEGIQVLSRSGDVNFDFSAMAAVEQAGRRGAFGPLPDGWVQDRLFVRFRFVPPG
jgi:hypothetical protein